MGALLSVFRGSAAEHANAVSSFSVGWFARGPLAFGLIAVGDVAAFGVFALSSGVSVGLFSVGMLSIGGASIALMPLVAALAVGWFSIRAVWSMCHTNIYPPVVDLTVHKPDGLPRFNLRRRNTPRAHSPRDIDAPVLSHTDTDDSDSQHSVVVKTRPLVQAPHVTHDASFAEPPPPVVVPPAHTGARNLFGTGESHGSDSS